MLRGLPLAEDQHVVQALAAQRANRPVYEFARGEPTEMIRALPVAGLAPHTRRAYPWVYWDGCYGTPETMVLLPGSRG